MLLDLSDLSNLLTVRFLKFKSPRILSERDQPLLQSKTINSPQKKEETRTNLSSPSHGAQLTVLLEILANSRSN